MHFGFITFRIQKQKKMVTLWGMKNEKTKICMWYALRQYDKKEM